jgi:multisubunit Na+/H+ antiporter MnhB subunit
MFAFVIGALMLGAAIAAYIKLPKDEETKGAIKLFKFTIVIMAMTLFTLFTVAVFGSTTSIKLF